MLGECIAHALEIAVVRVTNDPNYIAYRMGRKNALSKFRELLHAAGVDFSR
jgi:hypothetical protein